ncbi:MAG: hypothetical protein HWN65_24385, partial [Candidatus Helarchaeota archaeon]|nr:hypothetical protein [Candidatus Helarchaeota archaeon]
MEATPADRKAGDGAVLRDAGGRGRGRLDPDAGRARVAAFGRAAPTRVSVDLRPVRAGADRVRHARGTKNRVRAAGCAAGTARERVLLRLAGLGSVAGRGSRLCPHGPNAAEDLWAVGVGRQPGADESTDGRVGGGISHLA